MSAHSDFDDAITGVGAALATVRALQTGASSPIDATNALEVQALAEASAALEAAGAALTNTAGSRAYDVLLELDV